MARTEQKPLTMADYRRIAKELKPAAPERSFIEGTKHVLSDVAVEVRLFPTDIYAAYKVKLAQRLA